MSLKNKLLIFSVMRYFTLCLQFLQRILIAKFLGPFLFGIWGFINLLIQYLSYVNLGLQYEVNLELSLNRGSLDKNYIWNVFFLGLIFNIFTVFVVVFIKLFQVSLFSQYQFSTYILIIVIHTCFYNINQIFINIYRSFGLVYRIAFCEMLAPVGLILAVLLFRDNQIIILSSTLVLASVVAFFIFLLKFPIKLGFHIKVQVIKSIIRRGILLFLYNVSFYLILVSSRTIISAFYSVEELGYFSLANSIIVASMLGLNSILFVIFPKLLWIFREGTNDSKVLNVIEGFNRILSNILFFFILCVIGLMPVFFKYLNEYIDVAPMMNYLLLSQIFIFNRFVFDSFALSRKKQKAVAVINLKTVLYITLINLAIAYFHLNYKWIGISMMIGFFYCMLRQIQLAMGLLKIQNNVFHIVLTVLPLHILLPLSVTLLLNVVDYWKVSGWAGLILFIILGYRELVTGFKNVFDYLFNRGNKKLSLFDGV